MRLVVTWRGRRVIDLSTRLLVLDIDLGHKESDDEPSVISHSGATIERGDFGFIGPSPLEYPDHARPSEARQPTGEHYG